MRSLPPGRSTEKKEAVAADEGPGRRLPVMVGLAFVFAAAWFCSTAMAAHLPRVLQESGASLAAAVAAAALVGPAQVGARVLEFWLMRHVHPIVSARIASLAHPVGAAGLIAVGAPAASPFAVIHGAGNGVMTIASGALPLALFGAGGYGLRQGLLMAPARVVSASAPFVFDLLLARYGTHSLVVTAGLGLAAFTVLMLLPRPPVGGLTTGVISMILETWKRRRPSSPSRLWRRNRASRSSGCWCRPVPRAWPPGAIGEKLDLPPATLSFHLAGLTRAGLAQSRQDGRFVIYSAELREHERAGRIPHRELLRRRRVRVRPPANPNLERKRE